MERNIHGGSITQLSYSRQTSMDSLAANGAGAHLALGVDVARADLLLETEIQRFADPVSQDGTALSSSSAQERND